APSGLRPVHTDLAPVHTASVVVHTDSSQVHTDFAPVSLITKGQVCPESTQCRTPFLSSSVRRGKTWRNTARLSIRPSKVWTGTNASAWRISARATGRLMNSV